MSASGKRAQNLELYRVNLEQRVEQGDWSLVCRDEKVCQQVAGLLKDGWSQDTNPFPALDPLRVMEDSLKTAVPTPGRAGERTGLTGLEKAFEVLELAALNLYLCPWRKEYRVVKMFSGMFTHYVKPSLSRPQVLELFGLLGYHAGEAKRSEELCLRSPGLTLESLLALACAFFMARCECRLLLDASRKHAGAGAKPGAVEWELNLVLERQSGHSLEESLENTAKMFDAVTLRDDLLRASTLEADLDLYTAEAVERSNGQQEIGLVAESPRSPTWMAGSTSKAQPAAAMRDSNGVSMPRDAICVSTLNYQLTRSPSLTGTKNTSAARPRESSYGELSRAVPDRVDSLPISLTAQLNNWTDRSSSEGSQICGCPKSSESLFDSDAPHGANCSFLSPRPAKERDTGAPYDDSSPQEPRESRRAPQRARSLREGTGASAASPPSSPLRKDTTHSSSILNDFPVSPARSLTSQPVPLHECCDPASPDPDLRCLSCNVFHRSSCKNVEFCQREHQIYKLGGCATGCQAAAHVLCRYCGARFCKNCWYRRPLHCAQCFQPFDQSSSV